MGRRKKIVIEEWKEINGYNGDFEVSRSGKLRQNNVKQTVKTGTLVLVKNVGSIIFPKCQFSNGVITPKYKGQIISLDLKKIYSEMFPNEVNPFVRKPYERKLKKTLTNYIKKDKQIKETVVKSLINANPFSEALYSILSEWDELSVQDIKERLKWVAEDAYVEVYSVSEIRDKVVSILNEEIWKPVKETNGKYFVSNTGKMKSVLKGVERFVGAKCGWTKTPYVTYYVDGKKVNIQVAKVILKTFTGKEGHRVLFKDGNQNNLALSNLDWKD